MVSRCYEGEDSPLTFTCDARTVIVVVKAGSVVLNV